MDRRKGTERRNDNRDVTPEKRKGEDRRTEPDRRVIDIAMEIERRR